MAWSPRTTRNGLEYGGSANSFYWVQSNNPYASFQNCLANCTCYAYGRMLEAGCAEPITTYGGASHWHQYVNTADGWTAIPYDINDVEEGDIIEWTSGNHVAVVEQINSRTTSGILLSGSFYTDDNGTSHGSRTPAGMGGSTLQAVSNFMIAHYADTRFFRYKTLATEITAVGGYQPAYILKNPNPSPPPPPPPHLDASLIASIYSIINRRKKNRNVKIY